MQKVPPSFLSVGIIPYVQNFLPQLVGEPAKPFFRKLCRLVQQGLFPFCPRPLVAVTSFILSAKDEWNLNRFYNDIFLSKVLKCKIKSEGFAKRRFSRTLEMQESEDLRSNQISSWLNEIILIEIVVELICGKKAKVRSHIFYQGDYFNLFFFL